MNELPKEMNYCVPDFEMDDEGSIPTCSSSIAKHKAEEDVMELLWQNGQVVVQSQSQRSVQKTRTTSSLIEPQPVQPPPPASTQLFMAEDEMATWLHYPLEDLYADLLYPTSTATAPPPTPALPPPSPPETLTPVAPERVVRSQHPPPAKPPVAPQRNFPHFSRFRGRAPEQSTGLTVVDSNKPENSPATGPSAMATSAGNDSAAVSRAPTLRGSGGSGDMTVSSSMSGSGSGSGMSGCVAAMEGEVERKQELADDRKRKGRELDETTATTECRNQTEDVEHESPDEKKHSRGSSAKRSRAAEVHNLSERRRRDRINEKMRALQELIPRCNKSDKASMLDEAIEYLKSLQMQVQMMSMGCGMVPMMYPGMQQQYMPPMGMGMGMGMGMSRPTMPSFPSCVPASVLPPNPGGSLVFTTPAATGAPQLAPRFPVPVYPMTPVAQPGPSSGMQSSNQPESMPNPVPVQTPTGLPQLPNLADPYQQYLALQQMHLHMQMQNQNPSQKQNQNQSQSISQPGSSRPSSSKPSTSMSEEDFDDSQRG